MNTGPSPQVAGLMYHEVTDDPKIARWQTILNPFQRLFACGCHLNRRIDRLLEDSGFTVQRLDRFVMEGVPRPGADMYRGEAHPRALASELWAGPRKEFFRALSRLAEPAESEQNPRLAARAPSLLLA